MAMCMAARAGATAVRLRSLALAGLITATLGPPGRPAPEMPEGEGGLRALARRIHRKVLDLTGGSLSGPPVREAEVREDLLLLSIAREYWRRIGPPPEGGAEPAAAALALARGEIAGRFPERLRRLFLETCSAYPPGSWVRLESGEVGVVVAPGSRSVRGPLVLALLSGGEGDLRARPPRLIDTGLGGAERIRAVVRCPIRRCPAPRQVLRATTEATA
jgi:hypothetical protein